jgi:glycosyltransferase involved in cell wall biosynthesis
MRIAYIASGAGNMYCGSCLHDNTLAAALIKLQHKVALVPTYTPVRTDEESVSIDRVFYGGINVFLEQNSSLFRHTPSVIDRFFNTKRLLKWISRFTSSTDARTLGPLTVSVLRGEEGNQRKELQKLIEWLGGSYKPEIVHLTNSMFVGFARQMKKALNVPVVCSLQGEDIFLEELAEPYKTEALSILRKRARDVDGFIATSRYYADFMSGYLQIPAPRIDVVKLGLKLQDHGAEKTKLPEHPFVIGYLARICPEKGLHLLVEAFDQIVKQGTDAKLYVAGYLGKRDHEYFHNLLRKITAYGWRDRFEYRGEISREQKIDFLNQLHVLSVPTTYREPKGLYILEALANGVPVVQPSHGAFTELIEATGGGLLVQPHSSSSLAEGLQSLQADRSLREQLGQKGKDAIHTSFSDLQMAAETIRVYRKYVPLTHGESDISMPTVAGSSGG